MNTPSLTAAKPDTSQMIVIHRGMRQEFPRFAGYVRSTKDGDRKRAATVAAHIDLFLYFVHRHHSGEDRVLWPLLTERRPADQSLFETMERQHEAVAARISQIEPAIATWRETAGKTSGDMLARLLDQLSADLIEHLDAEEQDLLPIARETLTVAEWNAFGIAEGSAMPRSITKASLISWAILTPNGPAERRWFLGEIPSPIRLLITTIGKRAYDKRQALLQTGRTNQ